MSEFIDDGVTDERSPEVVRSEYLQRAPLPGYSDGNECVRIIKFIQANIMSSPEFLDYMIGTSDIFPKDLPFDMHDMMVSVASDEGEANGREVVDIYLDIPSMWRRALLRNIVMYKTEYWWMPVPISYDTLCSLSRETELLTDPREWYHYYECLYHYNDEHVQEYVERAAVDFAEWIEDVDMPGRLVNLRIKLSTGPLQVLTIDVLHQHEIFRRIFCRAQDNIAHLPHLDVNLLKHVYYHPEDEDYPNGEEDMCKIEVLLSEEIRFTSYKKSSDGRLRSI